VANHGARARARTAAGTAGTATLQIAARGSKIQPRHEAARRLFHDHQHFARVGGDLRCTTGPGQTHARVRIITDDGAVDVAEAIDLRRTEKAHVDAAALQVVREDLRQRYDAGRGLGEFAVAD